MIALLDCPLPGLAHMSGRAGRAVMDMMVGCTAALSCLPLRGFQRTVVHLQRRAGPARHRCPNRPATHSEASMRRTLISYYSFYTQQGSGPVQCGVPYDSWWQLRGSTRLDAVSPGLVNPSPPPFLASTIFCHQPTTSATTPGCNLDGGQQSPNISGMPQYFYISVNPFTQPLSQSNPRPDANLQICPMPTIQICPGAIVEVSASVPGDAQLGQSGFNFPF